MCGAVYLFEFLSHVETSAVPGSRGGYGCYGTCYCVCPEFICCHDGAMSGVAEPGGRSLMG